METIEQLFESKDIRITAMRLLIYKFLAEKQVVVTLNDIVKKLKAVYYQKTN